MWKETQERLQALTDQQMTAWLGLEIDTGHRSRQLVESWYNIAKEWLATVRRLTLLRRSSPGAPSDLVGGVATVEISELHTSLHSCDCAPLGLAWQRTVR